MKFQSLLHVAVFSRSYLRVRLVTLNTGQLSHNFSWRFNILSHLLIVSCLLMSSADAKSLNPDQARHFVGPDLDPNYLTLLVFLKDIFCNKSADNNTLVNVYVDLLVFTRIAGTS